MKTALRQFVVSLIVVSGIALFTIVMSGQPNQTPTQNEQSTPQKIDTSITPDNNQDSQTHSAETDSNPPRWYTSFKRPEWWLVIVGFLTLVFIAW